MTSWISGALLAGAGLALPAQSAPPWRFALQASAVNALGDLRSDQGSHLGIEGSLSLEIPLNRTLGLRPRVVFQHFPTQTNTYNYRSTRSTDIGTEYYKLTAWSLGADCLWHPKGPEGALYFLAGASLKAWRLNSSGSFLTVDKTGGTKRFTIDDTTTQDEPALDLGLGLWISRHVGLETRMTFATYRKLSYNTVQVGASWAF